MVSCQQLFNNRRAFPIKSTREKLLDVAEDLFSKNGFYGTSINDVAKQVNVSKQALLHHFSTKESLYAAVLESAANSLVNDVLNAKQQKTSAHDQLICFFSQMLSADDRQLSVIILLMRELLDNRERAHQAKKWFLRPFLDELEDLVSQAQGEGYYVGEIPLVFTYELLGAVQYFLVSKPTLKQLYKEDEYNSFSSNYKDSVLQRLNGNH